MEELEAAVAQFHECWWVTDPHVLQACAKDPDLDARLKAIGRPLTIDVFQRCDGSYDMDREAVHAEISRGQLAVGTPPSHPTVYFTIGCMGAGKTSVLRKLVHGRRRLESGADESSLARIVADEVREVLPGYGDGLGSLVVQAECFDVTYGPVFDAVAGAGFDIVYDTIGALNSDGTASFESRLTNLKARGYRIELLRADAPLEECIKRACSRALETGRIVKPEDQDRMYPGPEVVEARLRRMGLLDGFVSVNTYSERGTAPIIEASDEWRDLHCELEVFLRSGE